MKESLKKQIIRMIALLAAIALVIGIFASIFLTDVYAEEETRLTGTTADEWTALFDRRDKSNKRTWLGADGIFSIPLDGYDAFASATKESKTFFIFSDTLTGSARGNGSIDNLHMPNHTGALLTGDAPTNEALSFFLGKGNNGNIEQNLFVDYRCWMLDGFVSGNFLYLFGFSASDDWKPQDIELFKLPLKNGEPDWEAYDRYNETVKVPSLFHRDGQYLYAFGIGITANTVSAGAIDPDGYIYLYGYRDALREGSRKDLIVARIKETDLDDFSKVTYFDGTSWSTDITASAPLLSSVSCELSVTPVTVGPYAGKYIAVYTKNCEGADVMYAIGDSLTGPFSDPVAFYRAPEQGTAGTSGKGSRYCYNAKAHPALSSGTKLLISYNINNRCSNMAENLWTIDYHPRFLWLDLDPLGTTKSVTSDLFEVADGLIEVPEGTSAADALAHLTCSDASSALSVAAAGALGTDTLLSVRQSGITLATFAVVLRGDVTGDARILADDLTALARHGSFIEPFPVGSAR